MNALTTTEYPALAGRAALGVALLSAALACSGLVMAADRPFNAVDKAKTEYYAAGLRGGSLIYYPSFSVRETYDDNIYKTADGEKSDFITTINPALSVRTDLDMHEIAFGADGDFGFYSRYGSEDYKDYALRASGRLDLAPKTDMHASTVFRRQHEDRSSPENGGGDKPVEYSTLWHRLGFARALSIIKLYLDFDLTQFEYGSSQSDRDKREYLGTAKVSYELSPGYEVFTRLKYGATRYDQTGLVNRDSTGLEAQVGSDIYLTGPLRGDVYVGLVTRNYEGAFPDICDVSFGAGLYWDISQLWAASLNFDRQVRDTTVDDAAGVISTGFAARLDYAFRDNIFLDASARFTHEDYGDGSGPGREDRYYGGGLGAEYKFLRGMSARLSWDYSRRSSSVAAEDYNDNRLMLTLKKEF